MARYNNPDPLMIFLMLLAVYAGVRATENAAPRWLLFAAFVLGLGFMAKQLQAFLVLPAVLFAFLRLRADALAKKNLLAGGRWSHSRRGFPGMASSRRSDTQPISVRSWAVPRTTASLS